MSSPSSAGPSQDDTIFSSESTSSAGPASTNLANPVPRTDSVLSNSSSDDGTKDQPISSSVNRRSTKTYMEEASMETSLLMDHSSPGNSSSTFDRSLTKIQPSGRMGRRYTEVSESEVISASAQNHRTDDSYEEQDDSTSSSYNEDDTAGSRAKFEMTSRRSILSSLLPTTTKTFDESISSHDGDFSGTLVDATPTLHVLLADHILPNCRYDDTEAQLLHQLFMDFSIPPLSLDMIENMMRNEETRESWPDSMSIKSPVRESSAVVALLTADAHSYRRRRRRRDVQQQPLLWQLPDKFVHTFMRILIRLLSNDDVATTTTWNHTPDYVLYNVVRFQCLWKNHHRATMDENNSTEDEEESDDRAEAISSIVSLMKSAMREQQHASLRLLSNLLGILSVGGTTPQILFHWIQWAQEPKLPVSARVALVSALKTAAATHAVLSKTRPPRHFFCFLGGDNGLQRTLSGLASWPFRNDFGVALWVRVERVKGAIRLVSARSNGGGIDVSLETPSTDHEDVYTLIVSIFDSANEHEPVHKVSVRGCILLPRVWYHIAIRHTRSRLKGVFSLSTRQQLSVMMDGKVMLTDSSVPFPKIVDDDFRSSGSTLRRSFSGRVSSSSSSRLTLQLTVGGGGFEGETGAIYLFHDNVSDASFRALYELTGGRSTAQRPPSGKSDVAWDAKRSDIVRKSRVLDDKLVDEDADELVLNTAEKGRGRRSELEQYVRVVDIDSGIQPTEIPVDLNAGNFASKIFVSLDPKRVVGHLALELQSGAHVTLNEHVHAWSVEGAQDVIKSIGGIQALVPIFHSLLSSDGEVLIANTLTTNGNHDEHDANTRAVAEALPSLFGMLSSFIERNSKNARELLRCGGIDVISHFLGNSKRALRQSKKARFSFYGSVCENLNQSRALVESLARLEKSCACYIALETKVFSRLLFNVPLWLEGNAGASHFPMSAALYPVLAELTASAPYRVRDCIGTRDMVQVLKELLSEGKTIGQSKEKSCRKSTESLLRLSETLLGMIFTILGCGTKPEHLSPFLHFISSILESSRFEPVLEDDDTRLDLYREVTVRSCTILVFLFQARPKISGLVESFASCAGNVQSGASWILCGMVNVNDERIRALGIRLLASYVELTSHGNADSVLSLTASPTEREPDVTAATEATSNVLRASNTIGRLAKGLAAIGPSVRTGTLLSSKLTARVIYKLMWHFLKVHRFHLSDMTHTALLGLVTGEQGMVTSYSDIKQDLIRFCEGDSYGMGLDMVWAEAALAKSGDLVGKSFKNPLALGTVLRLIRFMQDDQKDQWLSDLLLLCHSSLKGLALFASLSEWQSCMFQLVSDTVEVIRTTPDDSNATERVDLLKRLDVCLDLYATVLGFLLRDGREKILDAVEMTASLQRTCVNGTDVLLLVLSAFCNNLFEFGTILDIGSIPAEHWKHIDLEQDSLALKQSARLVTDAILSQGGERVDMHTAVRSWRSLRHLTEIVVAVVTKCNLGVVDLFDYVNQQASSLDVVSNGLYGIRLPDGREHSVTAEVYQRFLLRQPSPDRDRVIRDVDRRLSVVLSAQVLSLIDAFVFPESLDKSLPASHLHGLALVRDSEARLGTSQGPLISSTARLSFILLSGLEPCSVKFLQCSSRLRCLLGWALELIREAAVEGPPPAFHDSTVEMDRLVVAMVLHCHRGLGRCASLSTEIETASYEKYFDSRDIQKKQHRRLLRASLELREVVSSAFRGRNQVLEATLSTIAFEALRSSLEGHASNKKPASKETMARDFLGSKWVHGFQDIEIRFDSLIVPEQVSMDTIPLSSDEAERTLQGVAIIEHLSRASKDIVADFERALDSSFEIYLEWQRKWTETDAVRELEYDGDTSLKHLTEKSDLDFLGVGKELSSRKNSADHRWTSIRESVVNPWNETQHWKLPTYPDLLGRRMVLVANDDFDPHFSASYELALGREREKEEAGRLQRLLMKDNLSEVMRRNADAFVPAESFDSGDTEYDSAEHPASDGYSSSDVEDTGGASGPQNVDENDLEQDADGGWDKISVDEVDDVDAEGDGDGWAKAFIWEENENVVARFEPVMIVSLQTYVEGRILLSSHGLYFLQTKGEVNVMTKEEAGNEDPSHGKRARRWRLSRLTEIHGRRYMLRPQALELFFADSHELLINFPSGTRDRDRFHAKIRNNCRLPLLLSPKSLNPRTVFRRSRITELWRRRKISNFEYLVAINRMAGRSFNDLTQYPVFPWVLSDYTSETLDLNDVRVYRDLSKPVGALNPDRLAQLLERYKDLELFGFTEAEKFLYGSHYSSPGIVLHFLIRQEPFTTMAIDLQSGRFDCPDRLFFDVAASWNSCMTSTSDMKELVPEFFYSPDVFVNSNRYPLGSTQSGRSVDDVTLPPWAKKSAHEFVRVNRLALESEFVSQNLHHWIDLVFGYKQRGLEAEAAHNLFHHLSYEGSVDLDKITDEVDRKAAESHIQNFGQTPSQLLVNDPHPGRYPASDCWEPLIPDANSARHLRCYTPSKQFANKRSELGRGAVMKLFVLTDTVLAIYADMSVGTYRWYPNSKNSLRMDKVRPLAGTRLSTSKESLKRGSTVPRNKIERSPYALSCSSFDVTIGGLAKENQRRKTAASSNILMKSESAAAASETSAMIVSCGYWDDTVKVHAADTLQLMVSEAGGHCGPIRCLAIGEDCGVMVSGGQDGTVRVWVVDHPDMAVAIADGYVQTAFGAASDGNDTLRCCHVLWGHDTQIEAVAVNWGLDIVVSGSKSGRVCVHTIRRGTFVRSFHPPAVSDQTTTTVQVSKLCLGPTGSLIVHTADRGLHSYTINGVCLRSTDARERLNDMILCSGDEILVTGGDRCNVLVRTVVDLKICAMLDLSSHGPIRCIGLTLEDLNPVSQFLFIGSDDGMITIVDQDPTSKERDKNAVAL